MPGDGTRTATTSVRPTARCLDLTRLMSRLGKGPDTGIDRVERAYLTRLTAEPEPLFALVRTRLGYILLDREGVGHIAARLAGLTEWGRPDLIGLFSRKATPLRRRAHADLRRLSIARCRTGKLKTMLRQHLPNGCAYLNVGHSNLRSEVFLAWKAMPGARISILIHDTIPLDFPQYQRPGTPEKFKTRLRLVSAHADLLIYNSRATRDDAKRWFAEFGRCPEAVVAHLGVVVPQPDPGALPIGIDLSRPYFVCIGTIEPRKNHGLLLDVWDQLSAELAPERTPVLIIIGTRGWTNEQVFSRLDTSPLMNRFVFERSGLGDAAMAAMLKGSRALLLPSHAEGFGLPPVEAVALGIPVICSKLPVYEEVLGNIPVYLDSDDVYLWKQSIIQMTDNKRAGHQRGNQALPHAKVPTWDDHFNLVLKLT